MEHKRKAKSKVTLSCKQFSCYHRDNEKKNILQAVFLFEVVFYITETMMNSFSTTVALVVVAV